MESFTDIFKSMDEVKAYAESLKGSLPEEDYDLMLRLLGLLENQGVSVTIQIRDQAVAIDRSIAPIIQDLNNRGIETLACCSGLQTEHIGGKFEPESGYLSLAYDDALLGYLEKSLKDDVIEVSKSECYLKPCVSVKIASRDDEVLEEKWEKVWTILKGWSHD